MSRVLQTLFIIILNPFVRFFSKVPERIRKWMIIISFLSVISLFTAVRIQRVNEYYPYYLIIGIICMVLMVLFSLNTRLKKISWSRPITYTWFLLCILMIISEIMVPKRFGGIGMLLLLLFPFIYFVWNNSTKQEMLWRAFMSAIRISFVITTVYALLFRPYVEGSRYSGFLINPNMYGMYLSIVFAVYLTCLDRHLESKQTVLSGLRYYLGIGSVFFFVYLTQARTSLLSIIVLVGFWLVIHIHNGIKEKNLIFFLRTAGISLLIICLFFPIGYSAIRTIPKIINRPVQYKHDKLYLQNTDLIKVANAQENPMPPMMVSAKVKQPNHPIWRIWDAFHSRTDTDISTGRFDIYDSYLKKLNMKGHRYVGKMVNGSKATHAHNNIIQFSYTYGILAGICYTILEILTFFYSFRYYKINRKKKVYAFLPFAIVCTFLIMTLTECVFLPFQAFPAFAYWFVIGILFPKQQS